MDKAATQEELEAGRAYETLFVPALFAPWTADMIDGVEMAPGARVLDVACGTGVLARAARARVGPTGRVVGLDSAPGMIATAREIDPAIDWVLGRAEALPFDDDAFDCVLCQFGLMFFADAQDAVGEMFRVLKPGGSLAVAVWQSADHNPAYSAIAALLDAEIGPAAGDAIRMPFSLGDAEGVAEMLAMAGFGSIGFEAPVREVRFPSTRMMVEVELRGWLPLFGITLDEEKIAQVLARSEAALSAYVAPSGEAVFPAAAYVITARKPQIWDA